MNANRPSDPTAPTPHGDPSMSQRAAKNFPRRDFLRRSARAGSGLLGFSWATKAGLLGGAGLVGGAGVVAGGAACGAAPAAPTVVTLFSPNRVIAAGIPQRIPIALVAPNTSADGENVALPADDGTIEVVVAADGTEIDRVEIPGHIVDHDHVGEPDPNHQHANLFRYYPLRTTLPEPGIYDLTINSAGATVNTPVQAFDPSEVSVPLVGQPFPRLSTPTFTNPDGVQPLCTRFEPCDLHDRSAEEVLDAGRPLALLVATPAFCSTAYCGPVLDTLIDSVTAFQGERGTDAITAIHVEVYANPEEVGGDFLDPAIRLAPAVEELGLEFEPSLFLVNRDGIIADRIDNVFDRQEIDQALADLVN